MTITKTTLAADLTKLSAGDPYLAAAYSRVGDPPLSRPLVGFAGLMSIIISQQLSTASAKAIFRRLEATTSPLTPQNFLDVSDTRLRSIGLSHQKISYGRCLALSVLEGRLDFNTLRLLDDEDAISQLIAIKGVGRWTAEIYLLFALRRTNIWPAADLGLAQAVQLIMCLETRPEPKQMLVIGDKWQPLRSSASLLLWHYLLKAPSR